MARCLAVVTVLFVGLASAAQARGSHGSAAPGGEQTSSGTYVGKEGDTGTYSRTVTSSDGTYDRQGSWSGTNGSGSYEGVGTRGGGSGSFDGTFSRNGSPVGTIQTTTRSTGDGHATTGERTKGNGVTHNLTRTRTLTPNGYVISGTSTSSSGAQRQRETVDSNGVAWTTITRPNGTTSTSSRTGRSQGQ